MFTNLKDVSKAKTSHRHGQRQSIMCFLISSSVTHMCHVLLPNVILKFLHDMRIPLASGCTKYCKDGRKNTWMAWLNASHK